MISTHSLNLLPPQDRKRIGHKRLIRFFTLCNGSIAALFATGIVLLLPTYFFLFFQNRGAIELLAARREATESEQAREAEARIQQTNTTLGRLQTDYNLTQRSLTTSMTDIVAKAPPGITLTFFSFEKETNRVLLRGNATTRNDLLQFISAIRNHPSFREIESPVENILKERNISFILSFTIHNEQNP